MFSSRRLSTVAGVMALSVLAGGAALGDTNITGGGVGGQVWIPAGSPYVIRGDIWINPGLTLTIEAGTVVAFMDMDLMAGGVDPGRVELTVRMGGSLIADGIPGTPVVFEGSTLSGPGIWYGMIVGNGAGNVFLTNTTIADAHTALAIGTAAGTTVLTDVEISDSLTDLSLVPTSPLALIGDITLSRVKGPFALPSGATLHLNEPVGDFDGDLVFAAAAAYAPVLRTAADSDLLQVTGAMTVGGTLEMHAGALSLAPGEEIVLVDNDGTDAVVGTFTGLAEGALLAADASVLQITYQGGSGNDVALSLAPPAWRPAPLTTWQVQREDPVNTSWDVTMYDIDLFDATEANVDSLHAHGRTVIASFTAGSLETWRPDAGDFPGVLIGNPVSGYPGEYWLDVAADALIRPLMEARLDLAVAKGFDGVEPLDVDTYWRDTGFPLTYGDVLDYNMWLAQAAHVRGLSIGLSGDYAQIVELEPHFDWTLQIGLYQFDQLSYAQPFLDAGKAVFDIEYLYYGLDPEVICPRAKADSVAVLFKQWNLGDTPPGACDLSPHEPVIIQVDDVGNDQGRQIRLGFLRSFHDNSESPTPIQEYELYRRVDSLPAGARDGGTVEKADAVWDLVLTRTAHGDPSYSQVLPTLADSTADQGVHWSVFFVRATTADQFVFYDSAPDSGYSVDNLAPSTPSGLHLTAGDVLVWDAPVDTDFRYFTLYGSPVGYLDDDAEVIRYSTTTTSGLGGSSFSYYLLTATDFAGNESAPAVLDMVSGVPSPAPARFALHPCVPNPFNPQTVIRFDLAEAARTDLSLYDLAGRRVRQLVDGETLPARSHERVWDGRDAAGRSLPSGTYLVQLRAGDASRSRRVTLLK